MPHTHIHTHPRKLPAPATALTAVLVCLGLAACGGSSSTSTITTTATISTNAANTSTSPAGPKPGRRLFANPIYLRTLSAFAACMRSNGIKLPAPDTSGRGPVFSTQGVNTATAQFRAASRKCQSVLRSAFPRPGKP